MDPSQVSTWIFLFVFLLEQAPLLLEIENNSMCSKTLELLWNFHLEKKTTSVIVKLQ